VVAGGAGGLVLVARCFLGSLVVFCPSNKRQVFTFALLGDTNLKILILINLSYLLLLFLANLSVWFSVMYSTTDVSPQCTNDL